MTNRRSLQEPKHLVMTFPTPDVLFRHAVTTEVDRVRRTGGTLRRARRNLQPLFPHVDLYRQHDVLMSDASAEVWFAFRDGREAVAHPTDTWWTRPGTARATVHGTGRVTGASHAFRTIFKIPKPMPPLVLAGDIIPDALAGALARSIFGSPAQGGLSSQTMVHPGTASATELELHVERDEVRQGRYDITVRTL